MIDEGDLLDAADREELLGRLRSKNFLWYIHQNEACGYDTYDSAVVCAPTEEEARKIHPATYIKELEWWKDSYPSGTWARRPDKVKAVKIGVADERMAAGVVVCASFNAG